MSDRRAGSAFFCCSAAHVIYVGNGLFLCSSGVLGFRSSGGCTGWAIPEGSTFVRALDLFVFPTRLCFWLASSSVLCESYFFIARMVERWRTLRRSFDNFLMPSVSEIVFTAWFLGYEEAVSHVIWLVFFGWGCFCGCSCLSSCICCSIRSLRSFTCECVGDGLLRWSRFPNLGNKMSDFSYLNFPEHLHW